VEFEKMQNFILDKLQRELPEELTYHNVGHVKDVYSAVLRHIAAKDLTEEDTLLLKTAALLHDSGFIKQAKGHEEISCAYASEYLPQFDYTHAQIDVICGMIMATKIPQSPKTNLEEILADADLDYLGRDDFFKISGNLFEELRETGIVKTEEEWDVIQVSFFEKHNYFTGNAKRWRDEKKAANLKLIKEKLSAND